MKWSQVTGHYIILQNSASGAASPSQQFLRGLSSQAVCTIGTFVKGRCFCEQTHFMNLLTFNFFMRWKLSPLNPFQISLHQSKTFLNSFWLCQGNSHHSNRTSIKIISYESYSSSPGSNSVATFPCQCKRSRCAQMGSPLQLILLVRGREENVAVIAAALCVG